MAERDLLFRVAVVGQSEFARELKGVHDLIRKAATEEVALARATALGKKSARTDEQRHSAAVLRTQLALEKARAKESVREAERAEKAKAKATDAAEKEKTRVAQREEKARQKEAQKAARDSIRRQQEELRAFEKSEREKTRVALREAKARQREEESIQRAVMRAQEATSRHLMSQRLTAQRQADRDARQQARDRMFDHKRFYRGVATGVAEGAAGAIRQGYGIASGAVRSIGRGLGAFEAFDIQDIVAERMYAKQLMRSAAIEAREAGSAFGSGGFDEVAGYAKVRKVSKDFGISQRDLLGAIDAASEKGSGADAVKNLERIAQQATAMGTDATTVAKMRAQIKMSSVVAGKELGDDKIDKMMAMMHFVGKTGVFRAEDLAKESESLVSSFVKGGGDLETGWKRFMTFSNEARKSVGSGAMARTAIMGVQDAIAKKESKINALGVKTRNADDTQRDFVEVVMDVIQKTGAKGEKFNQIFDPSKAGKAIATLVTKFKSAGGGAAGRAAMEDLLSGDESLKDATVAEMNKDAALRMDDAGSRIRKSVETIRQSLADKLAPILDKIAANAPMWAEKFGKLLQWVSDNPYKAAGYAITANAVVGGFKGGALPLGAAALRFAGDTLANKVPGFGAKAVGAAASGLGGFLSSATAQPVYITGAAPGVFGGGGLPGVGGLGGAAGGLGGAGGAAGASAMASVLIPAAVGAAVSLLAAKALADAGVDAPTAPSAYGGGKTDAQKAGAAIDDYNQKLGQKMVGMDADPGERALLAEMLGKAPNDPMVDALVSRVGDSGAKVNAVPTAISNKLDPFNAPTMGVGVDTPLGKLVTSGDSKGEAKLTDAITTSKDIERMSDAAGKVADKLERLDAVLAKMGANGAGSAFKPPGP